VAHFSDPWVDNPFREDGRAGRALNARLERRVIERADAVVFTSDATVDLVMRKYPAGWRDKVHVVPHAFDPDLYPAAPWGSGAVTLRYLGNFYRARRPDPLLRALRIVHEREPALLEGVRVEFVGSRAEPVSGTPLVAGLPDGLVRELPSVDYVESLALMRSADVLLVIDAPADHSVFLPSKLVDYIGADRPLLGITPPGAAADLVARAGGWVADPSDDEAVTTALTAALHHARSGADFAVPPAVRAEFEPAAVARRFAAAVAAARERA
jgi:glycosyltransferase involved in cell wall biosynthesis